MSRAVLLKRLNTGILVLIALQVVFFAYSSLTSGVEERTAEDFAINESDSFLKYSSEDYIEVIDRALFNWNRRSSPRGSANRDQSTNELGSRWRLIGLVNTPQSTYALFSEVEGERKIRIEQGMRLEDWTLESVDAFEATLSHDQKKEVFRLSVAETSPNSMPVIEETEDADSPDTAAANDSGQESPEE